MIVGDWGTSHLRLFRVEQGAIAARLAGPGIGRLPGTADDALRRTVAPWIEDARAAGILLCGMAGARGGLAEVPYRRCPVAIDTLSEETAALTIDGIAVGIVPGLAGSNFVGGADVMRGEETQVAGALRLEPDLARGHHIVALPGTHCKWVEIDDGRILRFHTMPTGELFALIQNGSTLAGDDGDRHAVAAGFAAGLDRVRRAEPLAALFEARAARLLDGRDPGWSHGFVSGALIGGECREALRLAGGPERVWLVGAAALCDRYRDALEAAGRTVRVLDGDACVVAGLDAVAQSRKAMT